MFSNKKVGPKKYPPEGVSGAFCDCVNEIHSVFCIFFLLDFKAFKDSKWALSLEPWDLFFGTPCNFHLPGSAVQWQNELIKLKIIFCWSTSIFSLSCLIFKFMLLSLPLGVRPIIWKIIFTFTHSKERHRISVKKILCETFEFLNHEYCLH